MRSLADSWHRAALSHNFEDLEPFKVVVYALLSDLKMWGGL